MSNLPNSMRAAERRTQDRDVSNSGERNPANFNDVKQDVVQLKEDVAAFASDAADTGIETIRTGAAQVAETGRKVGHAAKQSHERMCKYVSAHPTASVLMAAGAGALLARVLWRR